MRKIIFTIAAIFCVGIGVSRGQITNLYNFTNGADPHGTLTLSGNTLYGMTLYGGANGDGFVFSISTNGSGFRDLWDFDDTGSNGNANGAFPYGTLAYSEGVLYGMTYYGGSNLSGLIFSTRTDGTHYRDLWDFKDSGLNGNANGYLTYGSLTYSSGKLFGFNYEGGGNQTGLIFSIDTNGTHYKDVYDFNAGTAGAYPYYGSLAISASGNVLYGTTFYGGLSNVGMVYSVDTGGGHFKDLLNFDTANGQLPYSSVVLSGSKLFGMTYKGGTLDQGIVYTIDTSGNNYKDLLDFNNTNGASPYGELIMQGSKLYGMTYGGGIYTYGVIFSIDSSGSAYRDLYDFTTINSDGIDPLGEITFSGDTMFGMTLSGGTDDVGNIFSFLDTNISSGIGVKPLMAGAVNGYPNPTDGKFTLQIDNGQLTMNNEEIQIYNILGEQVYFKLSIVNYQFSIDLSFQPNGIYLYRVIAENGGLIGEGKVVIQK